MRGISGIMLSDLKGIGNINVHSFYGVILVYLFHIDKDSERSGDHKEQMKNGSLISRILGRDSLFLHHNQSLGVLMDRNLSLQRED